MPGWTSYAGLAKKVRDHDIKLETRAINIKNLRADVRLIVEIYNAVLGGKLGLSATHRCGSGFDS